MTIRRLLGLAAVAAAAAVPITAIAAPAHAAAPVDYVALGDSYSSGVGAPPYLSGGCSRSNNSYAAQWATTHAAATFAFPACGGATTNDVLTTQVASVTANTDLVTITIGGNDVGFGDTMVNCTIGSDSACINSVNAGITATNTTLPAKLDATYAAIRSRAPSARVVVLGYPRLISPTGSCGLFNLSAAKRTALNNGADILSGVIAGRAAAAGFTYLDARGPFATHGACGSSPWINRFNLFAIGDSYHPNTAGYTQGYLAMLNSVGALARRR
ncbi:SGNH/GDSL hydrolase family protein [Virgisporangium aurantiacum]|uniref:Lipase 1 n=1 Tax=Virgisporangium aurantiacum TaxID=175570 RepID=A0A8J3Z574_9ACTN|nr:SGNH/GDSL hydrolase family protein [Virgisporangium aurantiacum]GIJ55130.1 lipase 1 [Virgisporangium aurantiacum]